MSNHDKTTKSKNLLLNFNNSTTIKFIFKTNDQFYKVKKEQIYYI